MSGPGLRRGGRQRGQLTAERPIVAGICAANSRRRNTGSTSACTRPRVRRWTTGARRWTACSNAAATDVEAARTATLAWWEQFWARSYVNLQPAHPDPADKVWQVGRNYQLFRYMLGCNRAGEYPTKFNGGLFIYDPGFVREEYAAESADFRLWGGGSHTAQNQRLVYWPMLKSGDFDLMPPQFEYYRRALPGAEARTRALLGPRRLLLHRATGELRAAPRLVLGLAGNAGPLPPPARHTSIRPNRSRRGSAISICPNSNSR